MKNSLVIVVSFGLLAAVFAICAAVIFRVDVEPVVQKEKGPVRTRNFGEGISVTQKGLVGVELISIGRAHMRKLRKGPFTIGAINELVLEDVALVLPEALWKAGREETAGNGGGRDGAAGGRAERGPKAMLDRLGINTGHLKMGGKIPRFSALAIRNLRVARLEGTNAVPWFSAAGGKAQRDGLALRDGWSFEDGATNGWKEALLVVDPELKLFH